MMTTFPCPSDQQVTLANWRTSPFNRWAFHYVRELLPTADIASDPDRLWRLAPVEQDLSSVRVDDGQGGVLSLDGFLAETATDAFVIVYRGRIVMERYFNGMIPSSPHILMSVSKSLLGLLAGVLVARGVLDPEASADSYVPELLGSAFEGATVRQLLDMRSGLSFDEDYLATAGPIIAYRKSTGWNPLAPGETAGDLRSFLPSLRERAGPHGGKFAYISPCTDLLGWIIERASGRRYADLMSELIWQPMGAAHSACITVDRLGAPRCAGGMCVTATDLARVGQLLAEGGRRGAREIVPAAWIEDIVTGGDPAAWDQGSFVSYYPGRSMHYRAKCYVERGPKPMIFGLGIHGQNLFVDRARQLVIVKLSSQAAPLDVEGIQLTSRAVDVLRAHFD